MSGRAAGRPDHVHLDPLGGISGDMFIAAVLDAWPEARAGMEAAMRAAGLPSDWELGLEQARDGALTGRRFRIRPPASGTSRPTGHFREIVGLIEASPLDAGAAAHAVAILALIAEAEAEVHGIAVDRVHFHEIADWDSIADVVGAGFLIAWLGAASWSIGPLPLGSGRVATQHGPLPVPAPATAKLLQGLPVVDDGVGGERVTPTGAAIVRYLQPAPAAPGTPQLLAGEGIGFGTRTLPGLANALRVLGFRAPSQGRCTEQIAVIDFEVDDQTPEDLALGLERLRALDGVLDVVQIPAFGKKGRMLATVRLLARREAASRAIDACFRETTTIGLRWRLTERVTLARRAVDGPQRPVSVKVVDRPDGRRTAKAEIAGVADVAEGHVERETRRRAAEARALDEGGDG